ncbi:unnamed protein product, partial [Sphagnum troendelagicum]
MAVSIAGTVASKLLGQVMEATKIAISCNKCCKVLQALLKELQPIVDHAVRQISQSNFDNAFKSPRSAVHYWLDELEGTLKRAAVEVNKCIKQQPDLNPVSRYNTGKRILEVTESVKKLLQQAGLVGLAVTFSETSRAQKMEKMMQEQHEMMDDLRATALRIEFATCTQESLQENSIDAEPRCVGVWGMGGAGKTLLAQIAYNSREVRKHFKGGELIWLTVSQTPNIKGLYDSFWRQLGLRPTSFQLEEYRTRLYNEFLRRRVFIVLDDVWDKGVLEQLDLAKGRGSVTLVTTRNQPVLKKAGVIDEDEVQVGVLSKEDSWKLFCVHAFPRGLSNIPSQLQEVPELVAEECKGLPLALKVIGGSMVGKTTRQEWEFQLKCLRESRELPQQQEEEALFGRLKLSYDNLDNDNPVSKECFLGFAAFPEDYIGEMEELIKSWKAQGLLDDPTKMFGDDPTRSAYYLVGLLIGRSFIELAQTDAYKVHDVMRGLALHIIEGQNWITCLYRPGKELVEFPGDCIQTYERQPCEVRKLSLLENDLTTLNGVTFSAPKLRVLLLARNEKLEAMPKQFLKGIENLKVLDLSKCRKLISLPREIGNLTQLTHLYLDFCQNLESLPEEMGKLTQLTHLHLNQCRKLKSLPKEVGNLTQLTHLHLNQCGNLKSLPKEVGNLTQLTHLPLNQCGNLKSLPKEVGKLTQLTHLPLNQCGNLTFLPKEVGNLPQLTHLHLNQCGNLKSLPKEVGKLTQLTHLHLNQCGNLKSLPKEVGKLTQLTHLHLNQCGKLKSLPKEVGKLTQLTHLHLNQCGNLKSLPKEVGKLTQLIHLDLSSSCGLKKLPKSIGYLQSLQWVKITDCSNLKYLPSTIYNGALTRLQLQDNYMVTLPEGFKELQALVHLEMHHCPNLVDVQGLPWSLEYLDLGDCTALEELPQTIGKLSRLKNLDVQGCSTLKALPDSVGELVELTQLNLSNCRRLESLPDTIGFLSKLKKLWLTNCTKLKFLPTEFGKLQRLDEFWADATSLSRLPDSFSQLSNLEDLHLHKCKKIQELPSMKGFVKLKLFHMGHIGVQTLPEDFGHLQNLVDLHLYGCKNLQTLPQSFGGLQLQRLEMNDNHKLEMLPEGFGGLKSLVDLHIGNNSIQQGGLPSDFGGLSALTRLQLQYNYMVTLPEGFKELQALVHLEMHHCPNLVDVQGLPWSLEYLDLGDCTALEELPQTIGKLSRLKNLDVQGCSTLKALPDSVGKLVELTQLNLSNCRSLERLPDTIGFLSKLKKLWLTNCTKLKFLPTEFGKLQRLDEFWADATSLSRLPDSFSQLSNLEDLHLHKCEKIQELPSMKGLVKLKLFHMGHIGVQTLPEDFGHLQNLVDLHLYRCKNLQTLPQSFGGLQLQRLEMNDNHELEMLPEGFGGLKSLVDLHIGNNSIQQGGLPSDFGGLSALTRLQLQYNYMVTLPKGFKELQ